MPETPPSHTVASAMVVLVLSAACGGYTVGEGFPVPTPNPNVGTASFTATLSSQGATAAVDGPRLVARLVDLGVTASWTELDASHLDLQVDRARGPEILDAVLPPLVFEIRDRQGTRIGWEQVQQADLVYTEYTPDPQVRITFDAAGRDAFCQLSTANVRQPVDLILDGVPLSSPVVMEPICGGSAQISRPPSANAAVEAQVLMHALNTRSPLDSAWTIHSLR